MKVNNFWDKIKNSKVIISLFISVIALGISIKSCVNSNDALDLSKKEFQAKRLLILEASNGNFSPGFIFNPFDKNQKLQSLSIYFPSQFSNAEVSIESSDFHYVTTELQDSLSRLIKRQYSNVYLNNQTLFIPNIFIPIVIKSNYVAAGESLWDTSVYKLEYSFRKYNKFSHESNLNFISLIFIRRCAESSDYKRILN